MECLREIFLFVAHSFITFSSPVCTIMLPRILPATRRVVASSNIATRCVSASPYLLEKHTIKVPTMGDSITEGTIVEWTVQVGQAVKADDVVALIETDKVTVDIKADMDGVLTQQFGDM